MDIFSLNHPLKLEVYFPNIKDEIRSYFEIPQVLQSAFHALSGIITA